MTTQSKDPSHDTHRDDTENVYILIKYHGKDRLINIGKRDELDEIYLSKSPIPLLIAERNTTEQTRMIRIDSTDTHIHIRNYQHALAMGR